jgi:hypothetical protein
MNVPLGIRLRMICLAMLVALGVCMPVRAQYVDRDEPPPIEHREIQQPDAQQQQDAPAPDQTAVPNNSEEVQPQNTPATAAPPRTAGAAIWHDPGDPATLDLVHGIGGRELAPDPNGTYKFLSEDMSGTSPKFEVEDARGNRWRVKLAEETKSETAATRLLWAAGYFVDTDYYLATMKVQGLPRLRRGANFVDKEGIVHGAQLELKSKNAEKIGDWNWFDNPFLETREFNGLRIMMALLNNWDLKTTNNAVYALETGEQNYAISDLGATFGNTGNLLGRSKSKVQDFVDSKFIDEINAQTVDFVMHSRPPIFAALYVPYFASRTRMASIAKDIPRADAKWLGLRLSQLSHDQISDCFRSSGYSPEETEQYTRAVLERIAMLKAL